MIIYLNSVTRYLLVVYGVLGVAPLIGCRPRDAETLPLSTAPDSVCKRWPFIVALRSDGAYSLNWQPADSAGVHAWLTNGFRRFPPERRNVLVRIDSSRKTASAAWIRSLVAAAGGSAFASEGSCANMVVRTAPIEAPRQE
jgi:hypothetical protein